MEVAHRLWGSRPQAEQSATGGCTGEFLLHPHRPYAPDSISCRDLANYAVNVLEDGT